MRTEGVVPTHTGCTAAGWLRILVGWSGARSLGLIVVSFYLYCLRL